MRIAFFSTAEYDRVYFERYNTNNYQLDFYEISLSCNSLNLVKDHEVVCVFVNDCLDEQVIKGLAAAGVKLIALRCAGFNNVDLVAAAQCGIKVVHVPAYSPHAVAEHTLALILTLNRKLHKAYNRIREGNFSLNHLLGFDLYQKTVGVIGCGNIGRVVAQILLGFGCRVLITDPKQDQQLMGAGAKFVAQSELLSNSDIISLHCPLTPETHYLINEQSIKQMKDGVFIVNTSRGGLIDTKAAKQGLLSGKIGYLALDVYEQEQQLFFHDLSSNVINDALILELMMYPNVLITAHQGFFTSEALTQIATTTFTNIANFQLGKLSNQVSI